MLSGELPGFDTLKLPKRLDKAKKLKAYNDFLKSNQLNPSFPRVVTTIVKDFWVDARTPFIPDRVMTRAADIASYDTTSPPYIRFDPYGHGTGGGGMLIFFNPTIPNCPHLAVFYVTVLQPPSAGLSVVITGPGDPKPQMIMQVPKGPASLPIVFTPAAGWDSPLYFTVDGPEKTSGVLLHGCEISVLG